MRINANKGAIMPAKVAILHSKIWAQLPYFLSLSELKKIDKACQKLGVNRTTISRNIAALESELEVSLFIKNGPFYELTKEGEKLYQASKAVNTILIDSQREIQGKNQIIEGNLKVSAPVHLVTKLLVNPLAEFSAKYPQISLNIDITHNLLKLDKLETDIVIRISKSPPEDLVGRPFGPLRMAFYADKEKVGFKEKKTLIWKDKISEQLEWVEEDFTELKNSINVNDLLVTQELIASGAGVGYLPCFLAETDPRLERVSKVYTDHGWNIWILVHKDKKDIKRIRVFLDVIFDYFSRLKNNI
ncbi:LysR family transcriptional regulator [Marinomonas agarivorans]|nr:LysR family transcriptional regulator [Marinomonas agarivorans]